MVWLEITLIPVLSTTEELHTKKKIDFSPPATPFEAFFFLGFVSFLVSSEIEESNTQKEEKYTAFVVTPHVHTTLFVCAILHFFFFFLDPLTPRNAAHHPADQPGGTKMFTTLEGYSTTSAYLG